MMLLWCVYQCIQRHIHETEQVISGLNISSFYTYVKLKQIILGLYFLNYSGNVKVCASVCQLYTIRFSWKFKEMSKMVWGTNSFLVVRDVCFKLFFTVGRSDQEHTFIRKYHHKGNCSPEFGLYPEAFRIWTRRFTFIAVCWRKWGFTSLFFWSSSLLKSQFSDVSSLRLRVCECSAFAFCRDIWGCDRDWKPKQEAIK